MKPVELVATMLRNSVPVGGSSTSPSAVALERLTALGLQPELDSSEVRDRVHPHARADDSERAPWRPAHSFLPLLREQPRVPGGVVHKLPADLREALIANDAALAAWIDITPLARNEFICWVGFKQLTTRSRRIRRTQEELEEGQRRPCCWPGCKHRERTGR